MPSRLVRAWEAKLGRDWVTAIDGPFDDIFAVGSRDGRLGLFDTRGNKVGEKSYGSWVGAVRAIRTIASEAHRTFLWVGTKSGDVYCEEVVRGRGSCELDSRFSFATKNTVREIAISRLSQTGHMVAVGSEDRHVYILRHEATIAGDAQPIACPTNGWIRSVAFCQGPRGELLVAAGSGDKHVYFFDENGAEHGRHWMGAKVHSIAADERSPTVYCTSDARTLDVVSLRPEPKTVASTELPHRGTRLVWADAEHKRLFAVCEDGNVYAYHVQEEQLASRLTVGERIFSLSTLDASRDVLMAGVAGGRLVYFNYHLEADVLTPEVPGVDGDGLRGITPTDLSGLAQVVLNGPRTGRTEVGIGRFIDVVNRAGQAPLALVATDGGRVLVVATGDEATAPEVVHQSDFQTERVWTARGVWHDGQLVIDTGTSGRSISRDVFDVVGTDFALREHTETPLDDWPREVRGLAGAPEVPSPLVVACENGELRVEGRDVVIETGEILRSVAGRDTIDGVRLVTGSDNNRVSHYLNGRRTWSHSTDDRVREVLLFDDECIAVSEDRYLYRLTAEGELIRRFRFPHRALCVSRHPDVGGQPCLVVGCGDGSVYVIESTGGVVNSYRFPDRIRDVELVDSKRMLVACEDRHLYTAPTLQAHLKDVFPDHLGLVGEAVRQLRRAQAGPVVALAAAEPELSMLLLRYFDLWCEPQDSELAIALLDEASIRVQTHDDPATALAYARALTILPQRVSVAAALTRIEDLARAEHPSAYPLHALAVTVVAPDAARRAMAEVPVEPLVLVDSLLENFRSPDAWVREELLRSLAVSGGLGTDPDGFVRLGSARGVSFSVLDELLRDLMSCDVQAVRRSPLVELLRRLGAGKDVDEAPGQLAPVFERWISGLRTVGGLADEHEGVSALIERFEEEIRESTIGPWATRALTEELADLRAKRARFRHVAAVFWDLCHNRNPQSTAESFVGAYALHEFALALARRFDHG